LVKKLGVNAVKNGLPMIFRLQEDILEAETPIAKIRMGSLCHGYFWLLSERFDFELSPIGRAIQNEILRRRSKQFWIDRVCLPPIPLEKLGTPGHATPPPTLPLEEVESESLRPFDDRFQMVKLISLSYAESAASTISPPQSPGRSSTHPSLGQPVSSQESGHVMPEKLKEQMMSEWNRETVIATVQESSKTVSLNGSRSGTNATGHRHFLAVNGLSGGTNSGTQSPPAHHHTNHSHRSRPNSTYGLVGGISAIKKLRKESGQSPSPASDSSRNSVTRVDQLKRVLSGQQSGLPSDRGVAHSDASSESMVSYDEYAASELSYHPPGTLERAASVRGSNDRPRSKSRDRLPVTGEHSRPLSSNPVLAQTDPNKSSEDLEAVPPVPPIPSSLSGENTDVHDHAMPETLRKGRSVRRSPRSRGGPGYQSSVWSETVGPIMDLESLLDGIDAGGDEKGNIARPPY